VLSLHKIHKTGRVLHKLCFPSVCVILKTTDFYKMWLSVSVYVKIIEINFVLVDIVQCDLCFNMTLKLIFVNFVENESSYKKMMPISVSARANA
jgi:hypothetical protein